MAEDIDEAELIRGAIEAHAREFRVCLPGRIESYDASKQRASIRLQLSYYKPTTDGRQAAIEHPVIQNVPVAFPQGGGFFCSFPLAKGDPVTVMFSDVPIGAWLAKGQPCEPGVNDLHGIGGAIAFPAGPQPSKTPLQSADGTNMRLGKDGTESAQIEFTTEEIHLGVGASKGVARDGDTAAVGTIMLSVAGSAVLSGVYVDPDGGTTPIVSGTPFVVKAKIDQGSSKVKAED